MEYTLKKSLGQHFLHDENVCKQIVDSLSADRTQVLEIGPGAGAITKYLLEKNYTNYQCIELDKEKVDYLHKTYPALVGRIIHDDFIKAALPMQGQFTVIGNFPYNISTQIIFKVLDWREYVDEVVGMFQKEVAVRIASKHGSKDYGIMSVITQCYYNVEYLFDVANTCFTPPPKVVSGVIRLTRNNNPYGVDDYFEFKKFVKAAFSQRRKTLRNSLKSFLAPEKLTRDIFNKRAEQLSVQEFVTLYNEVK
jgi:16S rRNA (adenine1518-N6/adenine1519-N6)-dimethyltransferase